MKSFKDLDRLVEIIVHHHLPKEQILFMGLEEYTETNEFLKNLNSSGVKSVTLPGSDPDLQVQTLKYAGCTFHILNY